MLRTLYETAVAKKQWGIVRHCAGYLGRRVDNLSKVNLTHNFVFSVKMLNIISSSIEVISHESEIVSCFLQAVTDMVVRQKQVTVGMPPFSEVVVSGQGATYKSGELRRIIHEAHKGDESVAMLSQVYESKP